MPNEEHFTGHLPEENHPVLILDWNYNPWYWAKFSGKLPELKPSRHPSRMKGNAVVFAMLPDGTFQERVYKKSLLPKLHHFFMGTVVYDYYYGRFVGTKDRL